MWSVVPAYSFFSLNLCVILFLIRYLFTPSLEIWIHSDYLAKWETGKAKQNDKKNTEGKKEKYIWNALFKRPPKKNWLNHMIQERERKRESDGGKESQFLETTIELIVAQQAVGVHMHVNMCL